MTIDQSCQCCLLVGLLSLPVEASLKPVDAKCVEFLVISFVISPNRVDHFVSTISGQHVRIVDRQSPDADDEYNDEHDDDRQRRHDDNERFFAIYGGHIDDGEDENDDTDRQEKACYCGYRKVRERVVVPKDAEIANADDNEDNAEPKVDHVAKIKKRLGFLDDLDFILIVKGVATSAGRGLGRHVLFRWW